jgi:outer membrane protein
MQDNKNLSGIVRQTKEQELNDMNRRIQEFQSSAENQLQEKQNELFNPVYVKFDNAIKATGKENDFLYIFDSSQENLRYFDKTKSTDITALVKIKLGLK